MDTKKKGRVVRLVMERLRDGISRLEAERGVRTIAQAVEKQGRTVLSLEESIDQLWARIGDLEESEAATLSCLKKLDQHLDAVEQQVRQMSSDVERIAQRMSSRLPPSQCTSTQETSTQAH